MDHLRVEESALSYEPPQRYPLGLGRRSHAFLRVGIVAWSLVGVALVAYGLWRVAVALYALLLILGVALLIVIVLEPVVRFLDRPRVPRILATFVAFLAVLGPLGTGLWFLVIATADQVTELVQRAPELLEQAGGFVDRAWVALDGLGITPPAPTVAEWLDQNRETLGTWATQGLTAVTRFTLVVLSSFLGVVVAFYALWELPRIRQSAWRLTPEDRREDIRDGLQIVARSVGAFVRGQFAIAIVVGVLSYLALLLLGVPFAGLIGVIAGVTNLVPFLGPVVGGAIAVLMGSLAGGFWLALWVLIAFIVIQQFESQVLSPIILGASVRVRPVAIVISMLAGAAVAGLLGMILAVPVIASVKALWQRFGPSPDGLALEHDPG